MKTGSITYNGKNSLELGVYTTGSGSFDAAELDVDKYEIPGRNGDLILSNNRHKNIEITYPAFIPKAFMDKVQNVRNWLRSSRVYARLEDTYDTDHFRMGLASGVQSFEPANRNDGANFEMTFDCKPQRFLKAGETPETVEPDVQTASGEIVTFETVAESPITSAEVSLSPIQDLNGYDSPWPGGGGVNLLPPPVDGTYTGNGVTAVVKDGKITMTGTTTASGNAIIIPLSAVATVPVGAYIHYLNESVNALCSPSFELSTNVSGTSSTGVLSPTNTISGTGKSEVITWDRIRFWLASGVDASCVFSPMLCVDNTVRSFAPYSNICPISGHTGAELYVAAEYDAEDKTTYSVTFTDQGTVYGGTYDFVTGKLVIDHVLYTDSGSANWVRNTNGSFYLLASFASSAEQTADGCYCNYAPYAVSFTGMSVFVRPANSTISLGNGWGEIYATADELKAAFAQNPLQIVYKLATTIEYTLSAQQIETLLGENNVWSDAGPITLTYAEPYNVENPTIFEARPLFIITNPNQGDALSVNGKTITFVDSYTGTVTIDCETMDCYAGFSNMNYLITATDFPVLGEGTSIVTWSGSGECKMIPRWWEL